MGKKSRSKLGAAKNAASPIPVSDSMTQLTKPQLYSIYDQDIVASEESDHYEHGNSNTVSEHSAGVSVEPFITEVDRTSHRAIRIMSALAILSISGIAYHRLSENLHDNHLLHPEFASRPLLIGVRISQILSFGMVPDWLGYALEGIIFGSLVPLLDLVFNTGSESRNSLTSVLRAINSMLGITFGVRKVQWASSLQAAGGWGLLNVVMWLFFDGSMSMFISCSALAGLCCLSCYTAITDYSQWLYCMDFYFLGSLLFSKLGRYLYSS